MPSVASMCYFAVVPIFTCMKTFWAAVALLLVISCGQSFDPQGYSLEMEKKAAAYEEEVATTLAIKSLPGMELMGTTWDAQIGYVDDIPAFVRMTATNQKEHKMWWCLDTATGKLAMLEENTFGPDSQSVRRVFLYHHDTLVLSQTEQENYTSSGPDDFRPSFARANQMATNLQRLISADRSDLSAAANAARKRNAQFFASGKGWGLALNPSIKQVLFTGNDGVEHSFGYNLPTTGANGESQYAVRNLKEKLNFSITSQACNGADGRLHPYSVSVSYNGKTYTGCGSIIQ